MDDTKEELLRRIEAERALLNAMAERGLDSPDVRRQSEKLDSLVTRYYQILKTIGSSDFYR